MRSRPQTRLRAPWRRLGALLLAVSSALALGCDPTQIEQAQVAAEIRPLVDELMTGLAGGDDAALDRVTCLDLLAPAFLARRAKLGLGGDPTDRAAVAETCARTRADLRARYAALAQPGAVVDGIDPTRLRFGKQGGIEPTLDPGDGQSPPPITASGLVGLHLRGSTEPLDLDLLRLASRWCVTPPTIR